MVHMVQLARPNRPNVEWKMNENDGRSTELGVREKKRRFVHSGIMEEKKRAMGSNGHSP